MKQNVKAYSYVRMSTEVQLRGHSLQRQRELSEKYAEAHGLELVEESAYHDIGVSAFRSTNLTTGALGQFVDALKQGKIPRGSILLVESLDRLSRDASRTALTSFLEILQLGVDIVTLMDEQRYSFAGLDLMLLMKSLLIMERAHEESYAKSRRIKAAWENKKAKASSEGKKLTKMSPSWLRLSDDRSSFEIIPERAKVIKWIFEDCVAGLGAQRIARRLNEKKVPTWGRTDGWRDSYIKKVLQGRTVLGELAMHERKNGIRTFTESIENYYPSVISPALYEKAQAAQASRINKGGRRGVQIANLISGIAVCGYCLSKSMLKDGGAKNGKYLVCDHGRRGLGCTRSGMPYLDVEQSLLQVIPELDLTTVISNDTNRQLIEALTTSIDALTHECRKIDEKINTLVTALSENSSRASAVLTRITELEETRASKHQEKAHAEHLLKQASSELFNASEYQSELKKLLIQVNDLKADRKMIARATIQSRLRALIKEIRLYPSGNISDTKKEIVQLFLEENEEDPQLRSALLESIEQKKRERLYMVVFKSGRYIIVYPEKQGETGSAYTWDTNAPSWLSLEKFDYENTIVQTTKSNF